MPAHSLTIALSKRRMLTETLPLLATAGILPSEDPERSRKLILTTNREDVRLVIIRAADVPTSVEHGAADIGVTGKDVLMEYGGDGVYEPLDLRISRCRLMVAGPDPAHSPPSNDGTRRLRVATKYMKHAQVKEFVRLIAEAVERQIAAALIKPIESVVF